MTEGGGVEPLQQETATTVGWDLCIRGKLFERNLRPIKILVAGSLLETLKNPFGRPGWVQLFLSGYLVTVLCTA